MNKVSSLLNDSLVRREDNDTNNCDSVREELEGSIECESEGVQRGHGHPSLIIGEELLK